MNKWLIIVTMAFFCLVNTTYYWEVKIGLFAMPIFFLLAIIYFVLLFVLMRQLFLSFKEKFKNKARFLSIILLSLVLVLTFYKPLGIIDFDKIEGENLLIAQREGVANCLTTFKLKDNNTFKEKNVCFGVSEVVGTYRVSNDTIYFENVKRGKQEDINYEFGIVQELKYFTELKYVLKLFKNKNDTVGFQYFISKNDLKLKSIGKIALK